MIDLVPLIFQSLFFYEKKATFKLKLGEILNIILNFEKNYLHECN